MHVQPFHCYHVIERDKIQEYECSDRIILPLSYCIEMSINANDLLMLFDTCKKSVCGTVFGMHKLDPKIIYIPSWMALSLDVLEVQIAHVPKRRCTALRVRPHSSSFKSNPEFARLLNSAIQSHRSVTTGTKIPLLVEGRVEYLTIEEMLPSSLLTGFIYNCGELDVLLSDSPEPPPAPPRFLYKSAPGCEVTPFAFTGRGRMVGGKLFTKDTPQKAAADAALKRFKASQQKML
jgi:hypothetical protein